MQDIKEYLRRYIPARKYVELCFRELDRAEEVWIRSPKLDGLPKGSGGGGIDDQVARIDLIRRRAEKARADALAMLEDIEARIDALEDMNQRVVITMRYIYGCRLDEIAIAVHMSRRTVDRVHGKALNEMRKSWGGGYDPSDNNGH